MTTKLYTAAEARRIDIERGGEGRIRHHDWGMGCYIFTPNDHSIEDPCGVLDQKDWLPVTPEPEQEEAKYYAGFSWTKIRELEIECSRLQQAWEDENDKKVRLEKELAEATQNYHEILADHGEITRQFDELTEKQRWKSCRESSKDSKDVLFRDNFYQIIGSGHCSDGSWYLRLDHNRYLKLIAEQVKNWTWKYEADL